MSVKLSAAQTFRIARYLLENSVSSQRQVHRDLEISLGWINAVVNSLCEAGIARKGRRRRIELEDPYALLDLVSWQRPLQRLIEATVRLDLSDVEGVEKELRETCLKTGFKYALTAFSGLTRYLAYYMTLPIVHMYTDNPEQLNQMLPKGRGPITLEVLRPDYNWILKNARKVKEFSVVDPVQVVIDYSV